MAASALEVVSLLIPRLSRTSSSSTIITTPFLKPFLLYSAFRSGIMSFKSHPVVAVNIICVAISLFLFVRRPQYGELNFSS
jgi:hypothetical protein